MSLFDDATLILTPNGYSESELFTIKPTGLTSTLTVVRSTTATRINSDGEVETVPYNQISYSEQLNNNYWTKIDMSISADTISAPPPFTGQTADKVIPNTNNVTHRLRGPSISWQFGTIGTISVYAKMGENYLLRLGINAGASNGALFNLSAGTITTIYGGVATIKNVGDGWYKCVVTGGIGSVLDTLILDNSGQTTYAGNGSDGLYLWGYQLVLGTKEKDYFKTTDRLNVPRLDYLSGLTPTILLEPQTTNFILNSQTLTTSWVNSNTQQVTNDFFLLNSGKNLKVLISDGINTTANSMCVRTSGLSNIIKSGVNTLSFFVKKTSNHNSLTVWGFVASGGTGTGSYNVSFNVDTLVLSRPQTATRFTNRTGAIIPLGNNIFYCYETFTSDANYSTVLGFSPTTSGSNTMVPGQEMSIGGFQMEQRAYPTSYVPSLTSSATRNSDNVTLTGLTSNGILSSGGTWFFDVNLPQTRFDGGGNSLFFSVYNGIYVNAIMVNVTNAGYGIYLRPGTLASTIIYSTNATFNTMKMATSWSTVTGQMKIYFNGSLVNTTNGLTLSDYTTLSLSDANGGLNTLLRTRLNLMAFYNTILSDTQCIQLTN